VVRYEWEDVVGFLFHFPVQTVAMFTMTMLSEESTLGMRTMFARTGANAPRAVCWFGLPLCLGTVSE
jgi:hypothetical protein